MAGISIGVGIALSVGRRSPANVESVRDWPDLANLLVEGRLLGKTLIIGYGNSDREDDGVAWHILQALAERLGCPQPNAAIDALDHREGLPDLLCLLQLDPELAEVIADYDRVCFVDAHTGAYQEDIRFETLEAEFQASPFTHHMTPETCLLLAETLYGRVPQGVVVSVRGHQFGFSDRLSPATGQLAKKALERIISWLNSERA